MGFLFLSFWGGVSDLPIATGLSYVSVPGREGSAKQPLDSTVGKKRPSAMGILSSTPSFEPVANRATLLSLRAIVLLQSGVRASSFSIVTDSESLSFVQAVGALNQVPKPMECRARLVDTRLMITCKTMDDEGAEAWNRWVATSISRQLTALRADSLRSSPEPSAVLVRDVNEHILLSMAEYRAWRRDFRLRLPHSEVFEGADGAAKKLGAQAVLSFRTGSDPEVTLGPLG